MIKTLHITAIVGFLLAAGIILMPTVFRSQQDPQIEEFLSAPGVVERFKENYSSRSARDRDETPPLVRYAEDFANYLNPPAPQQSRQSGSARSERPARPEPVRPEPRVTASFRLIGTSYSPENPSRSMALLDMPGSDGFRWVRQSQRIEHLVVEEIGDGIVRLKDSSGSIQEITMQQDRGSSGEIEVFHADELPARQRPSRFRAMEVRPGDEDEPFDITAVISDASDSVSEPAAPAESAKPVASGQRGSIAPRRGSSDASQQPSRQEPERITPVVDEEVAQRQSRLLEDFAERLSADEQDESREALMEALVEQLRAARVSQEEADRLDDLGKELDSSQTE